MTTCANCENEIWKTTDWLTAEGEQDYGKEGKLVQETTVHRPIAKGECDVLLNGKLVGFSRAKWRVVKER